MSSLATIDEAHSLVTFSDQLSIFNLKENKNEENKKFSIDKMKLSFKLGSQNEKPEMKYSIPAVKIKPRNLARMDPKSPSNSSKTSKRVLKKQMTIQEESKIISKN